MGLGYLVLLAVVQGLTEFLPVSSSAHLILLPRVLDTVDQGLRFDVAANTGTFLSVAIYFRRELLDRYSNAMGTHGPELMRFMHENHAVFKELKPGEAMRERSRTLASLLADPDAPPVEQCRARIALFAINWSIFMLDDLTDSIEERRDIARQVAMDIVRAEGAPSGTRDAAVI